MEGRYDSAPRQSRVLCLCPPIWGGKFVSYQNENWHELSVQREVARIGGDVRLVHQAQTCR